MSAMLNAFAMIERLALLNMRTLILDIIMMSLDANIIIILLLAIAAIALKRLALLDASMSAMLAKLAIGALNNRRKSDFKEVLHQYNQVIIRYKELYEYICLSHKEKKKKKDITLSAPCGGARFNNRNPRKYEASYISILISSFI